MSDYIFISYAHKDKDKVVPIIEYLCATGLEVWYDNGIEVGSEWGKIIADKLGGCRMMIAFISPEYVASPNCNRETTFAVTRNKPAVVAYLQKTALPGDLELNLCTWQAVYRDNFASDADFAEEIAKSRTVRGGTPYVKPALKSSQGLRIVNGVLTDIGICADSDIVIPDGVTSIGKGAFYNCQRLTGITIPNSVTSIRYSAFWGCTSLTSITIPNSVTSIGYNSFNGCSDLESITVQKGNSYYSDSGNCLIEKKTGTLIAGCKNSVIPTDGSVASIGNGAFINCKSLTSITIPYGVTSIDNWAFSGCTGLTGISIPNSVTSVGSYAFSGCKSLSGITIPDSVTSVGSYAFSGCTGLTGISIPNSVTNIGNCVFSHCTSLTSITLPDSVTTIGMRTFCSCDSLTGISIPNSIISIDERAFEGCKSLTYISIPNGVTSIGSKAFSYCKSLTGITIPDSVTSIGIWAFEGCKSLTGITYTGTKARWNAISKTACFDYYNCKYTVHCTDGDISLR